MKETKSTNETKSTTQAKTGRKGSANASAPSAGAFAAHDGAIARRAYELFDARGRWHGHDLDDWLEAERQIGAVKPIARRATTP
jgi:hypothetical protein